MQYGRVQSKWKDNSFTFPPSVKIPMSYFYIAILYDLNTHSRYLKIGITTSLRSRYNINSPIGKVYRFQQGHNYTHVRLLAAIQVESNIAEDLERESRRILQQEKGLIYIPNDRFRYFLLPTSIEIPKYELLFKLYKSEYGEAYKIYGRLD